MDRGVRTFQTVYDATNGEALQVVDRDMQRIVRLCKASRHSAIESGESDESERALLLSTCIPTLEGEDSESNNRGPLPIGQFGKELRCGDDTSLCSESDDSKRG